jgi:hypothetical protein
MSHPEPRDEREARIAAGVRVLREGHGANCSSIGSVIDVMFASAVLGGAVFAAVVAALGKEDVRVVGGEPEPSTRREAEPSRSEEKAP